MIAGTESTVALEATKQPHSDASPRPEKSMSWSTGFWDTTRIRRTAFSYATREGGYQWVPGLGPYDADEVIQAEFFEVASLDDMRQAASKAQGDGTYEWASSRYFGPTDGSREGRVAGFPYTLPFSLGAAGNLPTGSMPTSGGGVFAPDVFEPGVFDDEAIDVEVYRDAVLDRLEKLEDQIATLMPASVMIGHNRPPEPIQDAPLSPANLREVNAAIKRVRLQARSPEPRRTVIARGLAVLTRAAATIGGWLARKADKAIDGFAEQLGKKLGGAAAGAIVISTVGWENVGSAMVDAVQAIGDWLHALPVVF
jgi:hypothetical protein